MSWYELPAFVRCIVIGFGLALLFSWLGSVSAGIAVLWLCTVVGAVVDGVRLSWKLYWIWTRECAWCSRRITPLTRNKLLSRELKGSENWHCSPRCYTEWHRRHYTERKQFNLLNEGSPLITIGKGLEG